METENQPQLSIDWFDSFSNSRVDKARAFTALDRAQQGNRRLAQAERHQHCFSASRLAPSALSCAAVIHDSGLKHLTWKSIFSSNVIASKSSWVCSPEGSTYSRQSEKFSAICLYVYWSLIVPPVRRFIRSVLDVIKGFLKRHTKNLGYMSIGLAAGVKRTMLFLFGVNDNVFDASGPTFGRSAFYREFVHTYLYVNSLKNFNTFFKDCKQLTH